jgi:hypothetical protein
MSQKLSESLLTTELEESDENASSSGPLDMLTRISMYERRFEAGSSSEDEVAVSDETHVSDVESIKSEDVASGYIPIDNSIDFGDFEQYQESYHVAGFGEYKASQEEEVSDNTFLSEEVVDDEEQDDKLLTVSSTQASQAQQTPSLKPLSKGASLMNKMTIK